MTDTVDRILAAISALSEKERSELFQRLDAEKDSRPPPTQTSLSSIFDAEAFEGPADYVIVFDGGSKGNPGPGYGSYALKDIAHDEKHLIRLDFGRRMTNNEAEYESRLEMADQSPEQVALEVRGDSALVINQIEGTWKTKDDRMRLLRNQCRTLLSRFKGHRLQHQDREKSVRVLGH